MKAYVFRLQPVQRVRDVEVARARQRVAVLARALAVAKSRELELAASYSSRSTPLGESSALAFVAIQESERRLACALAAATEQVRVVEAQLLRARGEAVLAEQRAGVIEHLDDRRRSEWTAALRHADALELDEFASARATATSIEANRVY